MDVFADCRLLTRPFQSQLLRFYKPSVDSLFSSAFGLPLDGRLPPGVGGSLSRQHGFGDLRSSDRAPAHQCLRNDGVFGLTSFQMVTCWSHSPRSYGQYNCGCIHQPSGQHALVQSAWAGHPPLDMVPVYGHHSSGILYSWPGQISSQISFPVGSVSRQSGPTIWRRLTFSFRCGLIQHTGEYHTGLPMNLIFRYIQKNHKEILDRKS